MHASWSYGYLVVQSHIVLYNFLYSSQYYYSREGRGLRVTSSVSAIMGMVVYGMLDNNLYMIVLAFLCSDGEMSFPQHIVYLSFDLLGPSYSQKHH